MPLSPVLPILFVASSTCVFYSSVVYVKVGAVVSLAVLAPRGARLTAPATGAFSDARRPAA